MAEKEKGKKKFMGAGGRRSGESLFEEGGRIWAKKTRSILAAEGRKLERAMEMK